MLSIHLRLGLPSGLSVLYFTILTAFRGQASNTAKTSCHLEYKAMQSIEIQQNLRQKKSLKSKN
jgi:hypothetical protein